MSTVNGIVGSLPGDDPTLEEMREHLKEQGLYNPDSTDLEEGEEALDGNCEAAIYYFASDYHGGQDSNLYSALSTSPYSPGPCSSLDSEGELARMAYDELVDEFATRPLRECIIEQRQTIARQKARIVELESALNIS